MLLIIEAATSSQAGGHKHEWAAKGTGPLQCWSKRERGHEASQSPGNRHSAPTNSWCALVVFWLVHSNSRTLWQHLVALRTRECSEAGITPCRGLLCLTRRGSWGSRTPQGDGEVID